MHNFLVHLNESLCIIIVTSWDGPSILVFHPQPHAAPMRDINNKERCFYLTSVRPRGCLHWYRFQQSGFKITPVVLPQPTMQILMEEAKYVYQGNIPISTEGILVISGSVPGA